MARASMLTTATDRTRLAASVMMTATAFSKAHHATRATVPVTARVTAEPPRLQLIASTSFPAGLTGIHG
jgi:hypothetical protein